MMSLPKMRLHKQQVPLPLFIPCGNEKLRSGSHS